jgi:hypothetical protein
MKQSTNQGVIMENEETPVNPVPTTSTTVKVLTIAGDALVLANAALVVKKIWSASAVAIRNYRTT